MQVVVDTNLVISRYITPQGKAAQIFYQWENEAFDLLVSEPILQEYERALRYANVRAIHRMTDNEIREIIESFREFAIVVTPKEKLTVVTEDPNDNMVVECGVAG